jgi:hypothetical protein
VVLFQVTEHAIKKQNTYTHIHTHTRTHTLTHSVLPHVINTEMNLMCTPKYIQSLHLPRSVKFTQQYPVTFMYIVQWCVCTHKKHNLQLRRLLIYKIFRIKHSKNNSTFAPELRLQMSLWSVTNPVNFLTNITNTISVTVRDIRVLPGSAWELPSCVITYR